LQAFHLVVWAVILAVTLYPLHQRIARIGDLAKSVLGFVAAIGGGLLMFMAALIVSGIIMAFGESGARGSRAIFDRVIGPERGGKLAELSTATRVQRGSGLRGGWPQCAVRDRHRIWGACSWFSMGKGYFRGKRPQRCC
jgi:hypothetical protein